MKNNLPILFSNYTHISSIINSIIVTYFLFNATNTQICYRIVFQECKTHHTDKAMIYYHLLPLFMNNK